MVKLGGDKVINVGGLTKFSLPAISPAYLGVGYIIGPRSALNFAGGLLAWGLLVPMLMYFLGPELQKTLPAGAEHESWARPGDGRLVLHRAAHRRGRHAGRRKLHPVPMRKSLGRA